MKISGKVCGHPVSWKIDSGAKRTFLTFDTYMSIRKKLRPGLKEITRDFITADGNTLLCDGECVLVMTFGDTDIFFPVIVGRVSQNLLGEDFIRHFKCNFDHDNNEFIICKGGFSSPGDKSRKPKRWARVVTIDNIEIPAQSETVIPVEFKDKPISGPGFLVPNPKLVDHYELWRPPYFALGLHSERSRESMIRAWLPEWLNDLTGRTEVPTGALTAALTVSAGAVPVIRAMVASKLSSAVAPRVAACPRQVMLTIAG